MQKKKEQVPRTTLSGADRGLAFGAFDGRLVDGVVGRLLGGLRVRVGRVGLVVEREVQVDAGVLLGFAAAAVALRRRLLRLFGRFGVADVLLGHFLRALLLVFGRSICFVFFRKKTMLSNGYCQHKSRVLEIAFL